MSKPITRPLASSRARRHPQVAHRIRRACLALAVVAAVTGASASVASAATWKMTLVARSCPAYTDVMANLARNDIQESLRDLGKDTVYSSGQPISPTIETPNHPKCAPLPAGGSPSATASTAPTPAPSAASRAVRNPIDHAIVTKASTELLNTVGGDTGNTIHGAVTVTLTDQDAHSAAGGNLWVQGGVRATRCSTPSTPARTASPAPLRRRQPERRQRRVQPLPVRDDAHLLLTRTTSSRRRPPARSSSTSRSTSTPASPTTRKTSARLKHHVQRLGRVPAADPQQRGGQREFSGPRRRPARRRGTSARSSRPAGSCSR